MRDRIAVLLASLLAACSVGPQYSPPELDVPAAFRAEIGVPSSLVGDTATAYFDLISFDQQLRVTARTVGVRQRFLELTQSRLRNGAAAAVDVNRAEASLAATQAVAADLKRQIAQTENRL